MSACIVTTSLHFDDADTSVNFYIYCANKACLATRLETPLKRTILLCAEPFAATTFTL